MSFRNLTAGELTEHVPMSWNLREPEAHSDASIFTIAGLGLDATPQGFLKMTAFASPFL